MGNLFLRIKKRISYTIRAFRDDSRFSVRYAVLRFADEGLGRVGLSAIAQKAHREKDLWILNMLQQDLAEVVERRKEDACYGTYQDNAPVWVCWWTGEDSAPALVKKCIRSIYKQAGSHPVHLITKDNYAQYLEIPQDILAHVNNGTMGLAHLADYIRVSLLHAYGGLWLDATIFCSQAIPDFYFQNPFFTCKSPPKECKFLSQMRWTTFVLGGWKGNDVYGFLKEALEQYWRLHSYAVDYLFFDHIIEFGRQNIPFVATAIDAVPVNNPHRDDLQAAMNAAVPAEDFAAVLHEDTVLYKLSWRETYSLTNADGNESVYARYLDLPDD